MTTVFVLDDDEAIRDALATLLGAAGLRVVCFATSDHLFSNSHEMTSGCLLLDISIPDRNGIKVFHDLRSSGIDLPVVFMTAHANLADEARALGTALAVFEKPTDTDSLLSVLREALDG